MVVSIVDNGMGIAEKDFNTIFAKYQRLTDSIEGTGIGLYLVKEIVNSSGGKITVQSKLGQGSVFRVFLKLDPQ